MVYNLSLTDLTENEDMRITWNSLNRDRETCFLKGKSLDDCNNYIRVLAKADEDELLVCGTNAYNPRCRNYAKRNNQTVYEVTREFSGKGYCPYDPRHNSTAIYADGELYSGTVSDFSGSDALIIKSQIRTGQYNLKELNGPEFVSSIEDEDFVYFFFREEAVEYMNCGKAVYSRVARVCKKDAGGKNILHQNWATYLKARLNCSIPGEFPYYFNEIQAVYKMPNDDTTFYGVFTTNLNGLMGSAVCTFHLDDVTKAFEGKFKEQESSPSAWLPVASSKVPEPRPGSCVEDTRELPDRVLNFMRTHPLMDEDVGNQGQAPVFYKRA